jgi:hypothetical protein
VTISELSPTKGEKPASADPVTDLGLPKSSTDGIIDQEIFESIYNPGKLLLLVSWRDATAAEHWKPRTVAEGKLRHRSVRVIRDYGMSDRREAPQFYQEVKKTVQKESVQGLSDNKQSCWHYKPVRPGRFEITARDDKAAVGHSATAARSPIPGG